MGDGMWNIAVCDDESIYIEKLKLFFQNENLMGEINYNIYEFLSGKELLEFKNIELFDVIFLDVDMPTIDGIEVAKKLRQKNKNVIIIFVTNHEEYVKVGYQVQAFRYVSKNNSQELREAVKSLSVVLERKRPITLQDIEGNHYTLTYQEVIYAETEQRHVRIHLEKDSFLITQNLQDLEEILKTDTFFRSHRGYLINMGHISSYTSKEIFLDNGDIVYLSKGKSSEFKSKYMQWKFERGNG